MTVGGYSIMLVPPHVTRVKHSSASFNGEHSGMTRASVSFPNVLIGKPIKKYGYPITALGYDKCNGCPIKFIPACINWVTLWHGTEYGLAGLENPAYSSSLCPRICL